MNIIISSNVRNVFLALKYTLYVCVSATRPGFEIINKCAHSSECVIIFFQYNQDLDQTIKFFIV